MIALVPIKENSTRLPNKNFKAFAGKNLTAYKLETLNQVRGIDQIVVTSDSVEVLNWVLTHYHSEKTSYSIREPYYGTSECDNSTLFEKIATDAPDGTLIYAPVTSPLVSVDTYNKAIDIYNKGRYDAVVAAHNLKEHVWYEGQPVNYNPEYSPNSQDLPDLFVMTYGFGILDREKMIEWRNIVGDGDVFFYELDQFESMDIDTEFDFNYAEHCFHNRQRS